MSTRINTEPDDWNLFIFFIVGLCCLLLVIVIWCFIQSILCPNCCECCCKPYGVQDDEEDDDDYYDRRARKRNKHKRKYGDNTRNQPGAMELFTEVSHLRNSRLPNGSQKGRQSATNSRYYFSKLVDIIVEI